MQLKNINLSKYYTDRNNLLKRKYYNIFSNWRYFCFYGYFGWFNIDNAMFDEGIPKQ